MQSGILELLQDASAVLKTIKALEDQEKKTRATLKALQNAKSAKAFLTEVEQKAVAASKAQALAEKEASYVLHTAKEAAQEVHSECLAKEKLLKDRDTKISERELAIKEAEKSIKLKERAAQSALEAAQQQKTKYTDLRKEYETKIADLKDRLSGL
jgi:hypothetical protein